MNSSFNAVKDRLYQYKGNIYRVLSNNALVKNIEKGGRWQDVVIYVKETEEERNNPSPLTFVRWKADFENKFVPVKLLPDDYVVAILNGDCYGVYKVELNKQTGQLLGVNVYVPKDIIRFTSNKINANKSVIVDPKSIPSHLRKHLEYYITPDEDVERVNAEISKKEIRIKLLNVSERLADAMKTEAIDSLLSYMESLLEEGGKE